MSRPTPIDAYPTKTSDLQADIEETLQEEIPPDGGGRVLHKNTHLQFLVRNLVQGFPARYMSQDASQPWLMFWTLQAFSTFQIAIDPDSKQRCPPLSAPTRCCVLNACVLGRSILSCSGSTPTVGLVVDRGKPHICWLPMRPCALSQSLGALARRGAGIR